MATIDRREFLRRAGGAALAIGAAPAGLELVRPAGAAAGSDARLRKLARELKGPVYMRGSSAYARVTRRPPPVTFVALLQRSRAAVRGQHG